jgi:hypothetical protein
LLKQTKLAALFPHEQLVSPIQQDKSSEQEQRLFWPFLCPRSEKRGFLVETLRVDPNGYVLVDDIPEVTALREEVRRDAWDTVRERQEQLDKGQDARVPLVVDALSTAREVIYARESYGFGSPVHQEQEAWAGLELDCKRLVAEWYRKKRPEYFGLSRHFLNAATGKYYSHGLSTAQMTVNALRPIPGDPEEVERRVNERVEDETPNILRKVGSIALGSCGMRTISECTDKAIRDYQEDVAAGTPHRSYGGYVPEIEKLMIRDMRFDALTSDRYEEQIGLPGTYITHDIIQLALERREIDARQMDKTALHGAQLLVWDDLIEFVELLDTVAEEQWCTNIFMGEEVSADYPKNYSAIREEAAERQKGLEDMAAKTAIFILDLAEDRFDPRKAPAHVESFVKKLLIEAAKTENGIAEQIFDARTEANLQTVVQLEEAGRYQEAFALQQRVEEQAPGGGYCSGGSCGLESVDLRSAKGQSLAKNLQAGDGDTVVRDKERACKCGSKSVVYAYNKNKVNKYCENCKAFESKATKAA